MLMSIRETLSNKKMINISPAALSNIDLQKGRDPATQQAVMLQGQVAIVWSCQACVPTDVGCYLGQLYAVHTHPDKHQAYKSNISFWVQSSNLALQGGIQTSVHDIRFTSEPLWNEEFQTYHLRQTCTDLSNVPSLHKVIQC